MKIIMFSIVCFILTVLLAQKPGDLIQFVALTCGLAGYVGLLIALIVHMEKSRFSKV